MSERGKPSFDQSSPRTSVCECPVGVNDESFFLDIDNQPGTFDNNNNIDNDFKNDLPMIRKMQIY